MSNRKLVSYKIVSADSQKSFEDNAARLINEGYVPYGELKILQPTGNFNGFFQAMVKYEGQV